MAPVFLNRRLQLQSRGQSPDGAGGFSAGWTTLGTLWAEVTARSGRVFDGGAGSDAAVVYRIVVRSAPVGAASRPVAGQRLVGDGRVFKVLSVADHDPRGRFLAIRAEEEVSR